MEPTFKFDCAQEAEFMARKEINKKMVLNDGWTIKGEKKPEDKKIMFSIYINK